MLWIALHLPWLSLEAFVATLDAERAGEPIALIDGHQLSAANAAARALGVEPGQKRATALALAPRLLLGQADAARDALALQAVAHAALAFTPMVCLEPAERRGEPAHTVLLEVRSTLRYFGGLARLLQRLREVLAPLGHRLRVASAATPLGAALLARGAPQHCADRAALQRALDALPVQLLTPDPAHHEAFQAMGLATLAELRRQPRAGLARRFGQPLLEALDRACGERPDPRVPITLPPGFESRLELFTRADNAEQLLHAAALLLARLAAWLAAQHAFVRGFTLVMQHEPRWRRERAIPQQTLLEVALAEPSRDPAHLQALLRERLGRLQLAAPTLELGLVAGELVPQAPPNGELFPSAASEREGLLRLIERLQARLGVEQVQQLQAVHDPRPEKASVVRPADPARLGAARRAPTIPAGLPLRPVWLLAPPEPLPERGLLPLLDGRALQLLSGPERVEAGWWDHDLAERDYFIAQDGEGALLWLYRARRPTAEGSGWYLQGRFA